MDPVGPVIPVGPVEGVRQSGAERQLSDVSSRGVGRCERSDPDANSVTGIYRERTGIDVSGGTECTLLLRCY